jgi:hypothetical protein
MTDNLHPVQLHSENIDAHYDEEQCLLFVRYRGVMSPAVTAQFYHWLGDVAKQHPQKVMAARGSIYDFREVTEFATSNLSSTARQSEQVNQQIDLHNHPVAIVARDAMQVALLTVTMKVSGQQDRKRIVRSEEEAAAFIETFHRTHR